MFPPVLIPPTDMARLPFQPFGQRFASSLAQMQPAGSLGQALGNIGSALMSSAWRG